MKSFLQGKKTVEIEPLRPPPQVGSPLGMHCHTTRSPVSVSTPGASSAHVEIVKEGDKVVRLIVHCVCGERVDIECLYSAGR